MAANKIDESDEKLKVFVTKLPYQTDEDSLKAHFEASFGPVTDVCIKRDESGNSKGFGFVLFQTEAAAALAIHNTQFHSLEGRQFAVKKVIMKEQIKKIFVGGVSPKITEEELREHFGQYGEIENVEVSVDKNTNIRRSFVFVVYKEGSAVQAAAAKAKQEISGFYVDVKKAVPMEQHQQGKGFHAYGFETLAARKSMLEAGMVPHPNPRGMPGARPPRARGGPRGAPRGAPRGGPRGRGRGAAAAYYDPYAAADPYAHTGYADPYAADPYAADPYADPYATESYEPDPYAADPYASDPYAADYSQDYAEDYSEDYSASSYYPPAPAAGGGKMRGRGGPRGAPRGGTRGAPRGGVGGAPRGGRGGERGASNGGAPRGGRGGPRGGRGAPRGDGGRGRGRGRAAPY